MESLFDKIFDEVLSTLKFSSNGPAVVTDKDSKSRTELALEITQLVMERVEEHTNPPKIMPAVPVATQRYFKSLDGRVWSTVGNTIIRYGMEGSGLTGYAETEIYETVDNLADCEDVTEITKEQFDKVISLWNQPF